MLKEIKDYLIEKLKERQRKLDLDLEFLEVEFFQFLKFIFINEWINRRYLEKKNRLNKDKFNLFRYMAQSKGYIGVTFDEKLQEERYKLQPQGIDFLLNFQRVREQQKHSNMIKYATLVIAFGAFVNFVDIIVNKETTKNTLLLLYGKAIGGILTLVIQLIPLILIIVIIYISYQIYKVITKSS